METKSSQRTIIWIVAAVLLCCCCAAAAIAGYYGYQAYLAAQQFVEDAQNIEIPTEIPFSPDGTPFAPGFDASGEVPEGGLADQETRVVAWASVQLVGIMTGCSSPTVDGTTITVTQQPDASGVWREEWNVNCGDGTFKAYPLTFTPENGIVNVSVDIQP